MLLCDLWSSAKVASELLYLTANFLNIRYPFTSKTFLFKNLRESFTGVWECCNKL